MLGKTNAVIGAGGGGGATVTAINKTGATITAGQKVWLNEQQQTQGSSYQIGTSGNYSEVYLGVIDRNGTFSYQYRKFYSINSDTATEISSANSSIKLGTIHYMADNSVFAGYAAGRIDGMAQYYLDGFYPVGDDIFINDRGSKIYQLDISNGSVIKEISNSNEIVTNHPTKVGNYIYRLYGSSSGQYKWLLDLDSNTVTRSSYTFTNAPNQYEIYSAGVTADNKYILTTGGAYESAYTNGGTYLYMVEVLENGDLRGLSQSEMPVDMQKWYSTKCGYVFNPYTGILTVYEYQGSDYGIYKYENGTWTQLPIDLGTNEETKFCSMITVSDDLSRACYNHFSNYDQAIKESIIVNLTSTSGYSAVPYKFYNVTENTITGYAGNDTEADGEVEVSVASMP